MFRVLYKSVVRLVLSLNYCKSNIFVDKGFLGILYLFHLVGKGILSPLRVVSIVTRKISMRGLTILRQEDIGLSVGLY